MAGIPNELDVLRLLNHLRKLRKEQPDIYIAQQYRKVFFTILSPFLKSSLQAIKDDDEISVKPEFIKDFWEHGEYLKTIENNCLD